MSTSSILDPTKQSARVPLDDVWTRINHLIAISKFCEADKVARAFLRTKDLVKRYEGIRAQGIGKYLTNHFKNAWKFDNDQLHAIASTGKNTIVSARAGSWKTQVIAGKVAFEIASKAVDANKILALSFNSKAAAEVGDRIRSKTSGFGIDQFYNAKTFHSLAYRIVQPKDTILIDIFKYNHPVTGEEIEIDTKKHKRYIQWCLVDVFKVIEPFMKRNLPRHLSELGVCGFFDEDSIYFSKREKYELLSYAGFFVRSKWERFLLDFLTQHGFTDIKYEPIVETDEDTSRKIKKPDVQCRLSGIDIPIYIEHWWVDESSIVTPKHWDMSKEEYLENRIKKRQFFQEQERAWKIIFLETSCRDYGPSVSKEVFYETVKNRIEEKLSRPLQKISHKELIQILRENDKRVSRFVWLIQRYINLAQLQTRSPDDMTDIIKQQPQDKESTSFLKVANVVYKQYEKKKKAGGFMDFNDLLKRAAEIIDHRQADITIRTPINNHDASEINLRELQLLLIDEYQDFSTLFYMIIRAIAKYNTAFRLFVVWDDWQAINQFAGAEIKYFIEFRNQFENQSVIERSLTTNYRSKKPIVDLWNTLMSELWNPAVAAHENAVWPRPILRPIDFKASHDFGWFNELLEKSLPPSDKITLRQQTSRKCILWEIIRIIAQHHAHAGEKSVKFMVILRNNRLYGLKIEQWKSALKKFQKLYYTRESWLSGTQSQAREFDTFLNTDFEILTAHKSKGKQADVVVLLDVSKINYPKYTYDLRADADYFSVFDDTPENQVENARKLLYVALTRAKSQLYVIADQEDISDYIREIF